MIWKRKQPNHNIKREISASDTIIHLKQQNWSIALFIKYSLELTKTDVYHMQIWFASFLCDVDPHYPEVYSKSKMKVNLLPIPIARGFENFERVPGKNNELFFDLSHPTFSLW